MSDINTSVKEQKGIHCTPAEAIKYFCCIKEGKCTGKSCMAWTEEVQTIFNPGKLERGKMEIPKTTVIKTDKGYCGLVKQ
jgi:hypothetical protein